jgi:hypothetical protein
MNINICYGELLDINVESVREKVIHVLNEILPLNEIQTTDDITVTKKSAIMITIKNDKRELYIECWDDYSTIRVTQIVKYDILNETLDKNTYDTYKARDISTQTLKIDGYDVIIDVGKVYLNKDDEIFELEEVKLDKTVHYAETGPLKDERLIKLGVTEYQNAKWHEIIYIQNRSYYEQHSYLISTETMKYIDLTRIHSDRYDHLYNCDEHVAFWIENNDLMCFSYKNGVNRIKTQLYEYTGQSFGQKRFEDSKINGYSSERRILKDIVTEMSITDFIEKELYKRKNTYYM